MRNLGAPCIWVHAVSVGEFLTAEPLILALHRKFPEYRIAVSTTTLSGQRLARSKLGAYSEAEPSSNAPCAAEPHTRWILGIFYFPFDWTFAVRRTLELIDPSMVVILETEIWPNFLRECGRRNTPVVIANGRISTRSHRRYLRIRGFICRVLQNVSALMMQSAADAERVISLGAPPDRVTVCGNLKYDVPQTAFAEPLGSIAEELDREFRLSLSRNLIVAGSTAPAEEQMLLSALSSIRQVDGLADTRLLVAPRHPERFDEVAKLVLGSGYSLARRSEAGGAANTGHGSADVILLDSIGELSSLYQFAGVVFVGGSLVPRGGHNIIEPAAYAKPIVVGPYVDNFRQIIADFLPAKAVVQIPADGGNSIESLLASELARLLSNQTQASEMGERARQLLLGNRGAIDQTVGVISGLLPGADQPIVQISRMAPSGKAF